MLPVITFFAVLRDIKTLDLMVLGHTQTDERIDHFQDRERSHNRQRSSDPNADGLIHELMCVAFQSAGGKHASAGIFENGIHRAAGEHAREQRAECASGTESL